MSDADPLEPPGEVVVEADGGSRGNPGPAAYGALLRDAADGRVLGERAAVIGVATNNVAEYSGLLAGLELVRELAPDARVEVRMDSKLVVEQMAGRWRIKHASLRPLALQAQRLAPAGTRWTWVPRAENAAADALVNAALDGRWEAPGREPSALAPTLAPRSSEPAADEAPQPAPHDPLPGWRTDAHGTPTTLLLLRHGVTTSTERRLFCGRGGSDPGLTAEGRAQADRAATWLARRGGVDAVLSSPLRRAQETATAAASALGLDVGSDDDLAEMAFGDWDGLDLEQVRQRWPDELAAWLADPDQPPPGGESLTEVSARVDRAVDRALASYDGGTVLVVAHVTPIKAVVRRALDAPAAVLHRMQLAPASLSTVQWWPDGVAVLRSFSAVPD